MTIGNNSTDSRTVFLVDDDSSTVNLYTSRLENAGFKMTSAFDAAEACEALPNLSADLIILNPMLPKRGGFDFLQAIRTDSRHKNTPVLILSNAYLPELAQRALRAGGNKALPRSECTSSELISVSRELTGVAETEDQTSGESLAESRETLLAEGGAQVDALRQLLLKYGEASSPTEGKEHLDTLYQSVRSLSTRSGLAGCSKVAQLTGAVEAMLFDHLSRSNGVMTPSSIQTLGKALESSPGGR
jgi:two-component system chemotaxis response regulator CheY